MSHYLKNDYAIAGFVYLLGLVITISFVLTHPNTISDHSVTEYEAYRQMLQHGGWLPLFHSNMPSCLMSTLVPAILQKLFGFKEVLLFNILPCLFYSMLPAFTYLVARAHLNKSYSLCATTLIFLSSAFVYPEGRVGIAVGFFSGLVWAISTRRILLAIIFAIFLPFSHYGTTYLSVVFLVVPLIYLVIRGRFRSHDFRLVGITLVVLSSLIFIWYNTITWMPAQSGGIFIKYTKISVSTIDPSKDVSPHKSEVAQGEIYVLESRESLIQDAFGKSFTTWNTQKKVAFSLSWLIILLMALGALYALYRRQFLCTYRILAITSFALLFVSVVIPYISTHYGVGRIYLTSLVVLSPMFMKSLEVISSKIKVSGVLIGIVILLAHSWTTNGTVKYLISFVV